MKKILQKIHLYLALVFFLPLVIQGLSGSILVFRSEISDFILRQNYEFAVGQNKSADEILLAVKNLNILNEENVIAAIRLPIKEKQAVITRVNNKNDKKLSQEIYLDPVSLAVIKIKNPSSDFFNFVKKLHTNLLIDGQESRIVVGIFGFVLLFMAITGIIIWWPKANNYINALKLNFKLKGVAFHRSLHKVFGFYIFLVMLVISFSGIYLSYPEATAAVINKVFLNSKPAKKIEENKKDFKEINNEKSNEINIKKALKIIEENISETKLFAIFFPLKNDQPFRFTFRKENAERGEPLITVFYDASQEKIINIKNPENYNTAEKIIAWMHPLHEGAGLGIIWKILVFITGLSLLLFTITGITMWFKKSKK